MTARLEFYYFCIYIGIFFLIFRLLSGIVALLKCIYLSFKTFEVSIFFRFSLAET